MKLLSFTILATVLLALFIPNIDATSNVRGGRVEEKKNIDGGHRALTCKADCEAAEEGCKTDCHGDPAATDADPMTHHECKHACNKTFEGCMVDCKDPTPTDSTPADSDVPTTTDSDPTPTDPTVPADPPPTP